MYGCCYTPINIVESRQALVILRNIKKVCIKNHWAVQEWEQYI